MSFPHLFYSYECDCEDTGFAGDHCEVDIPECASDPCQHGATCVEGVKGYTCLCWPGTEQHATPLYLSSKTLAKVVNISDWTTAHSHSISISTFELNHYSQSTSGIVPTEKKSLYLHCSDEVRCKSSDWDHILDHFQI